VPSKRAQANPNPNPNPTISKQHLQNINDALVQSLAEYEYFKVNDFERISIFLNSLFHLNCV
jgi:hypothetical protein